MMNKIIVVIISLLSVSCVSLQKTARVSDDLGIAEAVFRHQLMDYKEYLQNVQVCFISIDGRSPNPEFMSRFADCSPPVKPISASRHLKDRRDSIADSETGQRGIWFSIENIKRLAPDQAEAEGGHWVNGLNASGNSYILKKTSGKWVVEKCVGKWMADETNEPEHGRIFFKPRAV